MKTSGLWLAAMSFTCCLSMGSELSEVISNGGEGSYKLEETSELSPVTITASGSGGGAFQFERFLINHIQISNDRPAKIYYTKGDIMPPCLFVHVPSYPEADTIIRAKHIDQLRAVLGREGKTGDRASIWSYFKISPPTISVIYILASHIDDGKIDGISVFEAKGELAKMSVHLR